MSAEQALIWTSISLPWAQSVAESAHPVEAAIVTTRQDIRIRCMALPLSRCRSDLTDTTVRCGAALHITAGERAPTNQISGGPRSCDLDAWRKRRRRHRQC